MVANTSLIDSLVGVLVGVFEVADRQYCSCLRQTVSRTAI